ncbi:alpha/beta hydrolase [Kangiella geojedonensis]|uniref:Lipase, putative n=1 Tax=Kangiella geojedonensis TaxID=914150 RepID=A0A0F6TQK2_9GAMM|nr:lipase [Kangiella geojedonensis]AKE52139.1 Lipase, putative [Kangiella geojedonensis]
MDSFDEYYQADTLKSDQIAIEIRQKVLKKEAVILIHGMGRSRRSMKRLENYLRQKGYVTYNRSYPSTVANIERSAVHYINSALANISRDDVSKIHFVTHSLGGLLVRYYLSNHKIKQLGRIVMLAPPNNGSEVAERYRNHFWYRWMTGAPGQQLHKSGNALLEKLKPVETEVGVIAGTSSSDPWFNHVFEGEHDGKVSVNDAKLSEMKDLITVSHGHTFIMNKRKVKRHIVNFLNTGNFYQPQKRKPMYTVRD